MRTLTTEEMNAASGGVVPLVGLALAIAGTFVRHKAASAAINIAGAAVSVIGFGAYLDGLRKGEITVDGLSCRMVGE